jgi:HAD superfamily hydrolase (TIGR01484 family)
MIVRGLACDYDGTLASQDRIGPEALAALARAREAGLKLVLVTGRTFFDLTRVCDRLELFDAAVAENGAVLYWPRSQTLRDQAPAPSPRLLAELDRGASPTRPAASSSTPPGRTSRGCARRWRPPASRWLSSITGAS